MEEDIQESGLSDGMLAMVLQPPQNALQNGWVLLKFEKAWVGRDNRRGKTDPSGGITVSTPKGYELILALKVEPTDEDQPEGTLSITAFQDAILMQLAKTVESLVDEF